MSRLRGLGPNLVLAGVTALATVGVVEGIARFLEKRKPPRTERADYIWDWREKMPGGFYVIRSEAVGWPPWEEMNGDGLRDRTHAKEKPEGRKRVAILGDSVTLGDQIEPPQAFPRVLEALLDERGRPVDVMNVALWGWSTRQERIAWERIASRYAPDAVILAVCLNDIPELQNNLSEPPAWLASLHRRSAFVRRAVGAESREIGNVEQLFEAPDSDRVREAMERFFAEVRALRKDVEATGAGFSVIVFPFRFQMEEGALDPVVQRRVMEFCRAEGIRCLDLEPELRALGTSAFVDYDHLSVAGATRVAEVLAEGDLVPETVVFPKVLGASDLVSSLGHREAVVRQAAAWGMRRRGKGDIEALAERVRDESPAVRAEAARALGARKAKGVTKVLFDALADSSQQVRWAAARALFEIGLGPEDVRGLARALGSSDEYVRGFAAFTLGEMGSVAAPAVSALAAALDNADGYGRGGASSALAKLGPLAAPAVPALVRGLESDDGEKRWKAARTLGRIGPQAEAAVPALVRALQDANERVRAQAARALGRIAPGQARVALERAKADPDATVRDEAGKALTVR